MVSKEDGISVIVCCYNSVSRIIPTLQHLIDQKVSTDIPWEIILIDNYSNDDTGKVAQDLMLSQSNAIPFRVVEEKEPGLSNARNKGFEESKYEIVLMVDDDNSLAPNYVEGIYNGFENNPNIGMVGGLGIASLEIEPPKWFKEYAYCFAVGEQNPEEHLYGAGLGLRMSALQKLRKAGFESLLSDRTGNNLMSGGDTELCFAFRMAGYQLKYVPQLTFNHHLPQGRINWKYLRRLFDGFGQSKAFMEVYTSAIAEKPLPQGTRASVWKDRTSYLSGQIRSDLPLLLLSKVANLEGNNRLLLAIAKLGHIRKIKEIKEGYYDNYQKVYKLRDSLRAMNNIK